MQQLTYREATVDDLGLLVAFNQQLIQDEGHRNQMTQLELEARMRLWLRGSYTAILFEQGRVPVGYAVFRVECDEIYLRHFLVDRLHRRQGIGRQAIEVLQAHVWSPGIRIVLDVLVSNRSAYAFYQSIGFQDYAMTLELIPTDP